MNTTVGVPSNVVIRDLMLTLWFGRRRIFLIMLAAMAISGYAAFQVVPKYQAKSSLLVLLGPEHALRPVAGQQLMNSFNILPEEVLRTEADILDSNDLHRSVIEQIGVATLYPDLLKPPGLLAQLKQQAKTYVTDAVGFLGYEVGPDSSRETEPLVLAERKFNESFGVSVDKKSHVIQVSFQHPDRVLSAQTLKVLEARYFDLRGRLFSDNQVTIVDADLRKTSGQLAAADATLADFKRAHDVANFAERQKVLMTEQGALEDQLTKADSTIAGLQARLGNLTQQLRVASGQPNAKGAPNAAAPLQGMVEAYQRRQNEAQTTYRGSPAYDAARTEMLKSDADIAKMRSTLAFTVQQEFNKTEADLRTNQATHEAIKVQLADIGKQLALINADESQLHDLERTRGVIEESYKAIAKIATDRQVIENVDANRQSSVRVVEAPRIPDRPLPTRLIILAVGAIVGLVLSAIASLVFGFFRGVYLRPEALEADTGLAVFAVVPDQRALASPVVLVTPR